MAQQAASRPKYHDSDRGSLLDWYEGRRNGSRNTRQEQWKPFAFH